MQPILTRIETALEAAKQVLTAFTPGAVSVAYKQGDDPVTQADQAIDTALRNLLPREDEGWLSEETVDHPNRLAQRKLWIVDPLDGTREFVAGIPEWCVSIGYVEDGQAVAGGLYNPATDETFIGSRESGVCYNGRPARMSTRTTLDGARVLASRSEVKRGEWDRFAEAPFTVVPMGSVAYKLARVAVGLDDMTWTLVPKHEWDVAGGVAMIQAAGGDVCDVSGQPVAFNQKARPLLTGLIATPPGLTAPVYTHLGISRSA